MTLNNTTKTAKTVLFSALMLTLMVPVAGINVSGAVDENASPNALTRPEIPAAPDVLGCYRYTEGTGWVNVPCLTEKELKDLPRPTIGGASGVRGLKDSTSDIQSYGLTDVQFSTYSGESDSTFGTNAWSIQLNTNQWQNTGSSDWHVVQFTEQNHNTISGYRATCVWQINVSTENYTNHDCIAVSLQTLSSSYHGSMEGKVLANGNLQAQYCNIAGTTQCWVVTTTDDDQLGTHWRDNSGTILGMGSASTANFVSPTSVTTKVKTGPAQAATNLVDTGTQEKNNMSYGTSSTSCASNICTRTSPSSN